MQSATGTLNPEPLRRFSNRKLSRPLAQKRRDSHASAHKSHQSKKSILNTHNLFLINRTIGVVNPIHSHKFSLSRLIPISQPSVLF